MINQFRKDPFYLAKYHFLVSGILLCANLCLLVVRSPEWSDLAWYFPVLLLASFTQVTLVISAFALACMISFFRSDFHLAYLLAIGPAVLLTFPLTAFLHGGSHANMKPRWLNRPLGELVALIQLTGFPDWKILHVFHHQYPDHPELDPHPPLKLGYWKFTLGMRATIIKVFVNYYFKYHGQNERSKKGVRLFMIASLANMMMKVSFWFLLLGPQLFTFLFLSSVVFKMFHYAWFNYATHQPEGEAFVIKNLNHRLYKLVNLIAFGLYYHGNHHSHPNIFNPKSIAPLKKESTSEEAA